METAKAIGNGRMSVAVSCAARAALLAALVALTSTAAASAAEHRLGLGYLYWHGIDIESENIEEDGAVPFLTYQYVPEGIFRLELDLEYYADGLGHAQGLGYSISPAYSPSVYALVEFGLYAGVGAGVTYSTDGGVIDADIDPFYAVRLGWDFQVVPRLHVDLHANYRFSSVRDRRVVSEDIGGHRFVDKDSVTFGAAARIEF